MKYYFLKTISPSGSEFFLVDDFTATKKPENALKFETRESALEYRNETPNRKYYEITEKEIEVSQ